MAFMFYHAHSSARPPNDPTTLSWHAASMSNSSDAFGSKRGGLGNGASGVAEALGSAVCACKGRSRPGQPPVTRRALKFEQKREHPASSYSECSLETVQGYLPSTFLYRLAVPCHEAPRRKRRCKSTRVSHLGRPVPDSVQCPWTSCLPRRASTAPPGHPKQACETPALQIPRRHGRPRWGDWSPKSSHCCHSARTLNFSLRSCCIPPARRRRVWRHRAHAGHASGGPRAGSSARA
mmetsp:Transcript_79171/g.220094  ORF Transcript_79171/g.220094 Transcript_79171/m.220094 type:complete len:236 (+) Transcript_79171:23-730(+)